jgi:hypothetical protein
MSNNDFDEELTSEDLNERRRLERTFCRIRLYRIAMIIGCTRGTVQRWERDGIKTDTEATEAYRRIMRGIHNHVTVDYWPCPTIIKLAPDKWNKRRISELYAINRISAKCSDCDNFITGTGKTGLCQTCWVTKKNKAAVK